MRIAGIFAGLLLAASMATGASADDKVVAGVTTTSADAGMFIAADKGYFKEQGLDVELKTFSSALPMMSATATGQIDVARGAQSAGLFNGFARGIEFKMVADGGSLSKGGGYLALAVRQDLADKIKSAKDLKGMKVGIAGQGGTSDIVLDHFLQQDGLSLDDVQRVSIGIPDQIAAFANKSIDAAITLDPVMTAMIGKGLAIRFKGGDEIYPGMQSAILTYSPGFAKRTDPATRFMVAYLKGVRDYNDAFFKDKGTDDVIAILTKHTAIKDPAIYKKIVPAGLNPDGAINVEGLKADLAWYRKHGFVEKDLNVDDFVDQSFVKKAVEELGPYGN